MNFFFVEKKCLWNYFEISELNGFVTYSEEISPPYTYIKGHR